MKKNIIIISSIILIIGVMGLVLFSLEKDEPVKVEYTKDEIKFKDEYEKLNGVEIVEGNVLKTIEIENDNNVVYVSDNEILDLLNSGTNVIYMGWAECNWCRTMLPILLDVLKSNNIDKLYYYDFKSLRNAYENKDEEKSVIYEKIIEIIGKDIETVFDENSPRVDEKKILAPTVLFIKDGNYVGLHFKTLDSHEKASDELNDNQVKELRKIYQGYVDMINTNVCSSDEGC